MFIKVLGYLHTPIHIATPLHYGVYVYYCVQIDLHFCIAAVVTCVEMGTCPDCGGVVLVRKSACTYGSMHLLLAVPVKMCDLRIIRYGTQGK